MYTHMIYIMSYYTSNGRWGGGSGVCDIFFWAWWAQWCPQGHQMLWGKQKQRFSLGFLRFEAKNNDFP